MTSIYVVRYIHLSILSSTGDKYLRLQRLLPGKMEGPKSTEERKKQQFTIGVATTAFPMTNSLHP
ncbi:hypothetical protein PDE_04691 [Penicillium oxalicum 114-2]|uniref:Uncharacterized protein n=1 Tax=Penicillium oxalicum (strain 114-2 / CGMCC 5302) TaxID=933388 RepID=S7ZM15_PENO1|nr:hypothetical protein PDE_04691 [Penicillium oxalicum 114-2]